MASTAEFSASSTLQDEDVIQQLNQYKSDLNSSIKNEVSGIIHANEHVLYCFRMGSISKDMIMKTLMDFAAETSNIEDFADMIGDITMNLPDLNSLGVTVNAILEAQQFRDFAGSLLEVFIRNLGKFGDERDRMTGEELIEEISETVADYVAELAVDFVRDRVVNEESEDTDDL